jgi:hypothetical protein
VRDAGEPLELVHAVETGDGHDDDSAEGGLGKILKEEPQERSRQQDQSGRHQGGQLDLPPAFFAATSLRPRSCLGSYSLAISAIASFSRSMTGSPETSTMTSLMVPPVNA